MSQKNETASILGSKTSSVRGKLFSYVKYNINYKVYNVTESKTVLDFGFRISGTGFQSLSVELGFWISPVSGIPDSKAQDS